MEKKLIYILYLFKVVFTLYHKFLFHPYGSFKRNS